MIVYLSTRALVFFWIATTQRGENLASKQATFQRSENKYLADHVIKIIQADSEVVCGLHCAADKSCTSVNYKTSGIGEGRCELNKTVEGTSGVSDKKHDPEFNYLAVIERNPSHLDPTSIPSQATKNQELLPSCKELSERNRPRSSGVYKLRTNDSFEEYQVYCHMAEISGCGSGGWTPVMKIDGNKTEFKNSSPYWTNKETYEVEDGLEGLTGKQTKLASYWNTPFDKICLGMKVNNVTKWIVINHQASSLFNVIADGVFKHTTVGKNKWLSVMDGSLLQQYCDEEEFNINTPGSVGRPENTDWNKSK